MIKWFQTNASCTHTCTGEQFLCCYKSCRVAGPPAKRGAKYLQVQEVEGGGQRWVWSIGIFAAVFHLLSAAKRGSKVSLLLLLWPLQGNTAEHQFQLCSSLMLATVNNQFVCVCQLLRCCAHITTTETHKTNRRKAGWAPEAGGLLCCSVCRDPKCLIVSDATTTSQRVADVPALWARCTLSACTPPAETASQQIKDS